eukprot:scaffold32482_cov72-Phaeocystis_antarctica.AAC.6
MRQWCRPTLSSGLRRPTGGKILVEVDVLAVYHSLVAVAERRCRTTLQSVCGKKYLQLQWLQCVCTAPSPAERPTQCRGRPAEAL